MLWGNLRGLGLRQRLQFVELALFYLSSFTVPIYLISLAGALLGFAPLTAPTLGFVGHVLPLVVATELWLFVLNQPFNDRRARQRARYRELWKVRTMWVGLSPVFMKASIQAILGGPNRKPTYKVTLKNHDVRWHWRHTLPQSVPVAVVSTVAIYALRFHTYPSLVLLVGSVYWGALNVILLGNFVARGWHGVNSARTSLWSRWSVRSPARPTDDPAYGRK